ncbi:MAG TPA: GNAT family N-acetyltransferase [Lachnospiraceae bacterium]|nr:GNAT family N-acetyltransferase [Lachnospiraceae bacterium]
MGNTEGELYSEVDCIETKHGRLNVRQCREADLDSILELQDAVFKFLENQDVLRRNTPQILRQCLQEPNFTVGVYDRERLVGLAVLVEPSGGETDLRKNLKCHTVEKAADFKLVMVRKEYRGLGLQHFLMQLLEEKAAAKGYKYLCVSVSPDNIYSRRNIIGAGYEFDHREKLYGGLDREVYVKNLFFSNLHKDITCIGNL